MKKDLQLNQKDIQLYVNALIKIKNDPQRAVNNAKRIGMVFYLIGVGVLTIYFLFGKQLPNVANNLILIIFAVLVTFAALQLFGIKNILLAKEFTDWQKVEDYKNKKT